MSDDFRVTADWQDGICVVRLDGEARLENADAFDTMAQEIAERGVDRVAVNMNGLAFMDSASAGMLLRLKSQLDGRDGRLVLFDLRRMVARLMDRTGLDEQFHCVDTREEALAYLV